MRINNMRWLTTARIGALGTWMVVGGGVAASNAAREGVSEEVHNDSLQDRLVWPDDNWDDFGRRKVDDGSRIVSDGDGGISGARGSNGRLRGLLNGEHHGRGIDAKISDWSARALASDSIETEDEVPTPSYPVAVSAPTPVMSIPSKCSDDLPEIRWAEDTGFSGRLYLEGEGCATMEDLYKARTYEDGWLPQGPLYILDTNDNIVTSPKSFTGRWLLTSDLYVRTGAVLYCRGRDIGGDCDELRIESTSYKNFHEIRGHGGSLYFSHTLVTSWDTPNKVVQEVYNGGRSFINCVSEYESSVTCSGQPVNDFGECRMDILYSEMGYLGYPSSEAYGLTWKVRGYCSDGSNPEVFDKTNVYGDIIGSDIHHMYYGMYTYGHQGGVWTDNKMHDNHQYGFDPHDDSDYLTIARNKVYRNENHGIIASKRCNNVEIYDNEVYDGGEEAAGIFLHRSSNRAKVYDNYVHDMQSAGIAIMESFDNDIYDNQIRNVEHGIRISVGGGNNDIRDNEFKDCSGYSLYTYKGTDDPWESDDGRPGENRFTDNEITQTKCGVKIKNGDNTFISGNEFSNSESVEFYDAAATTWKSNSIPSSACTVIISGTSQNGGTIPVSTFTDDTKNLPSTGSC